MSKNEDNGSGEIEANDTAFRTNFNADASLSRYNQTHRGAFSFGYELPFGQGKRWLNGGGVAAYVLGGWQVQGIELRTARLEHLERHGRRHLVGG